MRSLKLTALVARAANYRESDRILTLITPENGKVTASSRGCRRQKSPLLAGSQPFCYGEYTLSPYMGRWAVNQCDLLDSFYDIRLNLTRLEAASAALGFAAEAMQEDEPFPDVFFLAYYALTFLAYGESPAIDLSICFYIKLLRAMGYAPATTRCAICGASTYESARLNVDAGALCKKCADKLPGVPVEPLTLEAMRRMTALPLENMGKVVLPPNVRKALCSFLPEYFANHSGFKKGIGELLAKLAAAELQRAP